MTKEKMTKEQKKQEAEVKRELAKQERELAEQEREERLHNSNSDVEAIVAVTGERMFRVLVIALAAFFAGFAIYLILESVLLCITIFFVILSLFR